MARVTKKDAPRKRRGERQGGDAFQVPASIESREPEVNIYCNNDRCAHRYNCKRYWTGKRKLVQEFNCTLDDCFIPIWEEDDD